jgi:hypothetical protein
MKIAVSGAVCTGKTTLGKALAAGLELPFIAENLENIFGRVGLNRRAQEESAKVLVACLEQKEALETEAGHFVVDRSPLDLMNFWQSRRLRRHCAGYDFYDLCQRAMGRYDFVVLTPWQGVPFMQKPVGADGPARTMDTWIQFTGSVRIAGLAHHFVEPARIIAIPRHAESPEQRLAFVVAALGAPGRPA